MTVSLSMIVRNEAERLKRCLASVEGFVDEMVLLDTGSTDATVTIAQQCGATVHQLPWPGDFAPARNEALRHVKGDWVLVLDADEQLLEEVRDPLKQLMQQPDLLVVTLLRFERGARQSPYSKVSRLFRRHAGICWSRPYHSMIDDSVVELLQREPHWQVADCNVPALLHDGYRPELLAGSDKASRLRQAMQAELSRNPSDPYSCAKLGSLEVSEGRRQQGIELLKTGLAHCPGEAVPERYELLLHLAIALAPSQPEEAIDLYRQALALPLNRRVTMGASLNLANLLLESSAKTNDAACAQQQLSEASELCREATAAAPELPMAWASLGLVERQRGRLPAAVAAYRQALMRDPHRPEIHQNLAAALLLTGDIGGARTGFSQAIHLWQQQGQPEAAANLRQRVAGLVNLQR